MDTNKNKKIVQTISVLEKEDNKTFYVEYMATADIYDILNYFASYEVVDSVDMQVISFLKKLRDDKILNMSKLLEISKKHPLIWNDKKFRELLAGYFACYQVERKMTLKEEKLDSFRKVIATCSVGSASDLEELDMNIEASLANTQVLEKTNISLGDIKYNENLSKDIDDVTIYQIAPLVKEKKTS